MTSVVVKKNYFSGLSKVQDASPAGLAAIIRSLAIDNARTAINALSLSNVTDNTTGTAASSLTTSGIIAPSGVFNAVSVSGVQTAAFNTSLGKLRSAEASWVKTVNKVLAKLGLHLLSVNEGTASYNTILAQDLTATGATGSTAVNYSSFVNSAAIAVANLHSLYLGVNHVLKALGMLPVPATFLNIYPTSQTLNLAGNNLGMLNIPAVVADSITSEPGLQVHTNYEASLSNPNYVPYTAADYVVGTNSVSLADGTAFLAAMANSFATLAVFWNEGLAFSGVAALTDSTGGTASSLPVTLVPVVVTPLVGYTDVSAASAQTAALNTLFGAYANAFSSIQKLINSYNDYEGVPPVLDPTAGTASSTLASETVTPAAGTGSAVASATFTESTNKNLLATDTITIGNQTFTIVSSIGTAAGNILVGADTNAGFAATMANIIASAAASISGGPATAGYVPNTTPANWSGAVGNGLTSGETYVFSALAPGAAGNSLASTYTASGTSAGSFGASTFAGGVTATSGSLTSIEAALVVIEDNISTLAFQLNEILFNQGTPTIIDTSGGVAGPTLATIPTVVVADNVVNPVGVANAAIETVVTAIRNNMSTLAASLTTIIGDTVFVAPIGVVAG